MQSETQNQTSDTFGYKWAKRSTFESKAFQSTCQNWLKERYDSAELPLDSLVRGKRLLDAGCGAGHAANIDQPAAFNAAVVAFLATLN